MLKELSGPWGVNRWFSICSDVSPKPSMVFVDDADNVFFFFFFLIPIPIASFIPKPKVAEARVI